MSQPGRDREPGVHAAVTGNAVPSGRSRQGPISIETLVSTSDTGVCPALTQVSAEIRYFSAYGGLEFSGASTV